MPWVQHTSDESGLQLGKVHLWGYGKFRLLLQKFLVCMNPPKYSGMSVSFPVWLYGWNDQKVTWRLAYLHWTVHHIWQDTKNWMSKIGYMENVSTVWNLETKARGWSHQCIIRQDAPSGNTKTDWKKLLWWWHKCGVYHSANDWEKH